MSKGSRQRRLKKERERQRRQEQSAGPGQSGPRPGAAYGDSCETVYDPFLQETFVRPSQRDVAVEGIGEAIDALCAGQRARYDSAVARLAGTEKPGWVKTVSRCVTDALQASAANAWRHGWQPAELTRHIERELTRLHASMLADMISGQTRGCASAAVDARWAAQVAGLPVTVPAVGDGSAWWGNDADFLSAWNRQSGGRTAVGGMFGTVATAIEVAHQLQHLAVLEKLLPLPGDTASVRPARAKKAASPADDRVLGKIRALLSKAESTEFAEEAEALSGRAQELMAKYSIDHALLAAAEGDEETPGGRRIPVDNPYESPKVQLLTEVARANRSRTVWLKELGLVTVVGFEADLDAVELLFTSLLVQANTAMMRAGAKQDARGKSRTRAFRQSFLVAYAYRIGERLDEATESAVAEAVGEQESRGAARPGAPGTALVPLLAAREEAVDDALDEMFGGSLTRSRAVRATDLEGWNSGRAAADLASLHRHATLPGN